MANKIYVVGFPRSGSSWVMQTLFLLKFPVFGIPHPPNRDPNMQPSSRPFWEHPDTLGGNLKCLGDSRCAVKVLLRKAIEYITPDPLTDKIIFCNRQNELIAQAITDWGLGSTYERNMKVIQRWKSKAIPWAGETPYLLGDVDWAKNNKIAAVTAIKNFIGSDQDITDAVENIV